MTATQQELADLRSALAPMSTAASRLGRDDEAAARMVEAVHDSDSATVERLFADMGLRGVSHRRGTIPVKADATRESFEYSPNERWHIVITIEIDKP